MAHRLPAEVSRWRRGRQILTEEQVPEVPLPNPPSPGRPWGRVLI